MSKALMTMGQGPLTMSSQEIADLVESRHDSVKRAIERLAERGTIQLPPLEEVKNHLGQAVSVFHLEKRDSYVVVAQLSPEFTARLVDRWQELEARQSPALAPAEMSRMDILQIAMQAEQERILAVAQRDEAVRTKALIGSRREATAMAKAAAKTREVEKLKHELGRNQQHATVLAVEKALKRKFARNAYVELRKAAKEFGLAAVDVVDARYGSVKAWPAVAWRKCFGIELGDVFPSVEAA